MVKVHQIKACLHSPTATVIAIDAGNRLYYTS